MTIKLSAKQRLRLNQFHDEYRQAEGRLQMAMQTLQGAQLDAQSKRVRFDGALEFVGGVGATFSYSPDDGVIVSVAGVLQPEAPPNGTGEPPRSNRASRRAAKKALGK